MYLVGKILKPKGLKGEVKVEIITSFPEHFTSLEQLYIMVNNEYKAYAVTKARVSGKFVFIKFTDIDLIEQAELLRNKELYIPESELMELSEGEFYIHQLIGVEVFDLAGTLLGEIVEVENYSASDIYVLKMADGSTKLIPAIKSVVKEVDISGNKMTIDVIDGLFE